MKFFVIRRENIKMCKNCPGLVILLANWGVTFVLTNFSRHDEHLIQECIFDFSDGIAAVR